MTVGAVRLPEAGPGGGGLLDSGAPAAASPGRRPSGPMIPRLRSFRALGTALLLPVLAAAGAASGPPQEGTPDADAVRQEAADDGYTVFLCPMHRDYQSAEPARCALCGMPLVRRTLVTRYVCLADETDAVVSETPGTCPATGEPLAPTTREVVWYCPEDPERLFVEPQTCEGGAPSGRTTRQAEHGDHNPRHGGVLFMAPDGVHHLEGALEDGAFRLWFYDSFTRPLAPAPFAARAVEADDRGAAVSEPVALVLGDGALEMAVATDPEARASFTAFVRFPDREEEDRFDFVFLPEAERARLAAQFGGGFGGESGGEGGGGLPELRVPESREAILAEIRARDLRVQNLIAAGRWADLFIPALEAKTLALAYGDRFGSEERPWVAIKRIVRGAWLLDLHGDAGDRTRVEEAYRIFAEGMSGLGAGSGGGR